MACVKSWRNPPFFPFPSSPSGSYCKYKYAVGEMLWLRTGLKIWTVVFHWKPQSCWILPPPSSPFFPSRLCFPVRRPLLHIKDALLIQKRFVICFQVSWATRLNILSERDGGRFGAEPVCVQRRPSAVSLFLFSNVTFPSPCVILHVRACPLWPTCHRPVSLLLVMWPCPGLLIGLRTLTLLKLPWFYNGF